MKVGIIGRGSVGRALREALSGTHDVRLGVRAPATDGEGTLAGVAAWAEAVVLATPWQAEAVVVDAIADGTAGKPVIDATNPVGMIDGRLDLVADRATSAAEALQRRLPAAHVVKGFNQIGAEFLADPGRLQHRPAMFVSGDEADAKAIALRLAQDAGFEAVDGGPLSNARHLEALAMLWIWSAVKGPLGRSFGFALSHIET